MPQHTLQELAENPGQSYRDYEAGLETARREERFIERMKLGCTMYVVILAALLTYHWLSRYF